MFSLEQRPRKVSNKTMSAEGAELIPGFGQSRKLVMPPLQGLDVLD
jgi:hypothetical protein